MTDVLDRYMEYMQLVKSETIPQYEPYINSRERELINDVLDRFMEHKKISSSFIDYIAATYSCKAATKAGDSLEPEERRHLIDSLFATKNPYHCPHGRPIIINLSIDELDRRFERNS